MANSCLIPAHCNKPQSLDDTGQALVELAVSLPLFLLLVLGTAEIANIAWAAIQLNNAVHAGAQYGSISRTNAANATNVESAAQNEAPSLNITFPAAPTQACSCVTPGGTSTVYACTAVVASCSSPDIILASVKVTAQASVRPIVHYPGLPATYTLHAQASMGIVQ
jgi:Flp pilus assembly protein TadG